MEDSTILVDLTKLDPTIIVTILLNAKFNKELWLIQTIENHIKQFHSIERYIESLERIQEE